MGFLWEERPGNGFERERKDLERCRGGAEVVCVSKHADGSSPQTLEIDEADSPIPTATTMTRMNEILKTRPVKRYAF